MLGEKKTKKKKKQKKKKNKKKTNKKKNKTNSINDLHFVILTFKIGCNGYTVDSRYLEFQGTLCRIEKKIIRTNTFNKCICNWTLEVRYIENILEKRRN